MIFCTHDEYLDNDIGLIDSQYNAVDDMPREDKRPYFHQKEGAWTQATVV